MARRLKNEGSIYRRGSDARWAGARDLGRKEDGIRNRYRVYGASADDVRKALNEARAKHERGELLEDKSAPTLAAFASDWLDAITPDLKPRTVLSYRQLLDCQVLAPLGSKTLADVSRADVKRLLTEKRKSFSKNTVRLIQACISALYADAIEEGLASANPAAALSRRDRRKRAESISTAERVKAIRPFSASELASFLDGVREVEPVAYPSFFTLARAGLRPGEAFALKPDDLDFSKREILVERALSRGEIGTTKTGGVRRVDMSQELAAVLSRHLADREKAKLANGWRHMPEWIFVNSEGNIVDDSRLRKRFARAMKAAGLSGHRIYGLRHSFATILLANGAPITYVAAQLGHAKPTTTLQWYAH